MKKKKSRRRSRANRPAPPEKNKDEALFPEEGLLAPLFRERSDERLGTRRSDKSGQPLEPLADMLPSLD
ncbi:hypothetical protein Taro_042959 [Colocasia esculenta]|uniref:Uncharacterized protein n=1 Tax=Colocasia esculenta TaxID=4460 RepID=A0A843X0K1_COLES|nr:hypothetical protein [Colocasia esculenta]